MHDIWDQLALFEPQCDAAAGVSKFAEYRHRMRVMQFLSALNDEFESVRASLLHQDPLPCLETVVSDLLTEETVPKGPNMISRDRNNKIVYRVLTVYI